MVRITPLKLSMVFFIIDQHKLLKEGNLGSKHHAQLLKGEVNMDPRDRVWFDASTLNPSYHNHKPQREIDSPQRSQKKRTCQYFGKNAHVEKVFYKKRDDLEEKIKCLERDMFIVC
jgi:hypothetical protein